MHAVGLVPQQSPMARATLRLHALTCQHSAAWTFQGGSYFWLLTLQAVMAAARNLLSPF